MLFKRDETPGAAVEAFIPVVAKDEVIMLLHPVLPAGSPVDEDFPAGDPCIRVSVPRDEISPSGWVRPAQGDHLSRAGTTAGPKSGAVLPDAFAPGGAGTLSPFTMSEPCRIMTVSPGTPARSA